MRADLEERRREMWERLVVYGEQRSEVEASIADEYDLEVETVSNDIDKMATWLPKLVEMGGNDGTSQLRELRRNRHRLQELANRAMDDGDVETEVEIRRHIDRSVERDIMLCQALSTKEGTGPEGDEGRTERERPVSGAVPDTQTSEQQEERPEFRDFDNGQ